jgi:hypothetical protein
MGLHFFGDDDRVAPIPLGVLFGFGRGVAALHNFIDLRCLREIFINDLHLEVGIA